MSLNFEHLVADLNRNGLAWISYEEGLPNDANSWTQNIAKLMANPDQDESQNNLQMVTYASFIELFPFNKKWKTEQWKYVSSDGINSCLDSFVSNAIVLIDEQEEDESVDNTLLSPLADKLMEFWNGVDNPSDIQRRGFTHLLFFIEENLEREANITVIKEQWEDWVMDTHGIPVDAARWAEEFAQYLSTTSHIGTHQRLGPLTSNQLRKYFMEMKKVKRLGVQKPSSRGKFSLIRPHIKRGVTRDLDSNRKTNRTKIVDFYEALCAPLNTKKYTDDTINGERYYRNLVDLTEAIVGYYEG